MKLAIKQSNFFAAAMFGAMLLWFGAQQAVHAAAGMLAWSDLPGLMMLAVLVCGLLAIGINFVWLEVLAERGQSTDEPESYWPTRQVAIKVGLALLAAMLAGIGQGLFMP